MTTVLKLGGSLITEKDRPETLDGPALDDACDAIAVHHATEGAADAIPAAEPADLVLVHGAGSFGHHYAEKHGVTTTEGTHDAAATVAVHAAMKTLNQFVVARLHERGVPALPVHPLSVAARDEDGGLSLPATQVATMLEEGFVPVLHGDGVIQNGAGITILSGDEVVVDLAASLSADRVGLCSTVPGVLDGDDEVIPRIEAFADVADVLGDTEGTDVTGGMAGKVRTLLDLQAPASVFGGDDLERFLAGESPGTEIRGT